MTPSKISHFLVQLYIIKSYNFHLTLAFNYEFHTLTPEQLAEDIRSVFSSLQAHKTIFNPSPSLPWLTSDRPFVPLINVRNKKIKSWTHSVFPTFEWNQEPPTFPPFPPCHLIILPLFPPHLTSLPPTFYFPEAMQHNIKIKDFFKGGGG